MSGTVLYLETTPTFVTTVKGLVNSPWFYESFVGGSYRGCCQVFTFVGDVDYQYFVLL